MMVHVLCVLFYKQILPKLKNNPKKTYNIKIDKTAICYKYTNLQKELNKYKKIRIRDFSLKQEVNRLGR